VKPNQFERIKELFQAALEQKPADREAFLDQACQGDEVLFQEVVSLLAEHEKDDDFLEIPSLESEPSTLEAGDLIGVYRIERELGRGGMGVVYLALETSLASIGLSGNWGEAEWAWFTWPRIPGSTGEWL
jgi:serine/threonine-protein kinase